MKRTILFFVICCLSSFYVSGQYNPGYNSGSVGSDTTKLQQYFVVHTLKIPERKGVAFNAGINLNLGQQGGKNKIRLDTLFVRNVSHQYKYLEIGVTYQPTLTNMIRTNYITSDKFHGWKLGFSSPFNFR